MDLTGHKCNFLPRGLPVLAFLLVASTSGVSAQTRLSILYGADRNVESVDPEFDGWLSTALTWSVGRGLTIGLGADHRFEGASPRPSDHQASAVYVLSRLEVSQGPVAPWVGLGVGLGPAPCESDTCGDGLYLRGSAGARVELPGRTAVVAEVGLSRVGRPFAGVGLEVAF